MAFLISDFADWYGLGREGVPASPARGIAVFTKNPPSNQIIRVSAGAVASTAGGQSYRVIADFELNESETFQPAAIEALTAGGAGNAPANQTWSFGVAGVAVTNPNPISGGADAIAERKGIYPQRQKGLGPSDTRIKGALAVATATCRSMMGLADDADFPFADVRVKEAAFLIALYRIENISTQEVSFPRPSLNATSPQIRAWFRAALHKPLMAQAAALLRHKTNIPLHINGRPQAT